MWCNPDGALWIMIDQSICPLKNINCKYLHLSFDSNMPVNTEKSTLAPAKGNLTAC